MGESTPGVDWITAHCNLPISLAKRFCLFVAWVHTVHTAVTCELWNGTLGQKSCLQVYEVLVMYQIHSLRVKALGGTLVGRGVPCLEDITCGVTNWYAKGSVRAVGYNVDRHYVDRLFCTRVCCLNVSPTDNMVLGTYNCPLRSSGEGRWKLLGRVQKPCAAHPCPLWCFRVFPKTKEN